MAKASAKQNSASAVHHPPYSTMIPEGKKNETAEPSKKSATPAKKMTGKAMKKTKKLSHVKTPDALKDAKKKKKSSAGRGRKVKSLSLVKTPEAMKKKARVTPMKRKTPVVKSARPAKKARN